VCCTAGKPGGRRPVPRGLIWGMVGIETSKGKGISDCILGPSSMLFTARNGNFEDHHHITTARQERTLQHAANAPAHLGPQYIRRRMYPCCTANQAQEWWWKRTSQHATPNFLPVPNPHAARSMQHAARRLQSARCLQHRRRAQQPQAMSAQSISPISALAEPRSRFPHSISRWGDPCLLGLHKAE